MLLAPLLPVLSETCGRRDRSAYNKTVSFAFAAYALICIPPALLQACAPWLTLLPFGQQYHAGQAVVRWLMLNGILFGLIGPMSSILISTGQMWLAQGIGLLYAALYLGLGWWLIPRYGAAGFAAAGFCAMALANVPTAIILLRQFPDAMRASRWLPMLALSTLCGTGGLLLSGAAGPILSLVPAVALAAGFAAWLVWVHRARLSPASMPLPVKL